MRHVKLYKKRGVPGITRVEDDEDGKKTVLEKGKFDAHVNLRAIEARLKAKKIKKGAAK